MTPLTIADQAPLPMGFWDFSGGHTEAGLHFLLEGIFPTQGWQPCLLHWQVVLLSPLPLSHHTATMWLFLEPLSSFSKLSALPPLPTTDILLNIHFLRVKWNTKQFQLLTLLNLVKRLDQGNKFLYNRKRGYSFFFYPRDFLFQSKKLTVCCPLPCVSFLRIAIRNFHFWKYCDSVFGICRL